MKKLVTIGMDREQEEITKTDVICQITSSGIREWLRGEMIGKGSFATVYIVQNIIPREGENEDEKNKEEKNVKYVAKVVNKSSSYKREQMLTEIAIHKRFDHSNIVKLIDNFETNHHVIALLEYCQDKTLLDYRRKCKIVEEVKAKVWFLQVIAGLEYMHNLNVIHRDVKPENILLHGESVKLCDFGLSATIGENCCIENIGSPLYQAPETISENDSFYRQLEKTVAKDEKLLKELRESLEFEQYRMRCFGLDVWSLGVCLYYALIGKHPFNAENRTILNDKILNLNYSIPDRAQLWLDETKLITSRVYIPPNDFKTLINGIFVKDDRLTLQQVKTHSFFASN